jgi:ATP-dependent Clp protease ATP-binding subunit ClpB
MGGAMDITDLTKITSFCQDLTEQAKEGKIQAVVGRDQELRTVIETLCRAGKSNPLLVGPSGVGKTALAHSVALKVWQGDVPQVLKESKIYLLDIAALKAGTGRRGDLEKRLRDVLGSVRAKDILLVDNIHVLLEDEDVTNVLLGPLSRGDVRMFGVTSPMGYKEVFEKNKALARCFHKVDVEEPDVPTTVSILRSLRSRLEAHHGIRIQDAALFAAAKLSHRYIQDLHLPDKAIDLLDTAATSLRMESETFPSALVQMQSEIESLRAEYEALVAEGSHSGRISEIESELHFLDTDLAVKKTAWVEEKKIHASIRTLQAEMAEIEAKIATAIKNGDLEVAGEMTYVDLRNRTGQLELLRKELSNLGAHFIRQVLGEEDIAALVSKRTGIPLERVGAEEGARLLSLDSRLAERVVGQDHVIERIVSAVQLARAGIGDPARPLASFLLLGPTGVGKTEIAKALAEQLFDSESAMIRLDMSEFMEKHAVARLVGSPPGYVGHEEGGQLTEAVRRKPFSVVLLDESEKAHPEVWSLLLQVLDDGRLTDSQSRVIDFRNTIILMTSNLGSKLSDQDSMTPEELKAAQDAALRKYFRPEFLNRLDGVLTFKPLAPEHMRGILEIQLGRLKKRLELQKRRLVLDEQAISHLATEGYDPAMGARPLKRLIQTQIAEPIAKAILGGKVPEGSEIHGTVGVGGGWIKLSVDGSQI